jgi:hypothetical protein
MWNFPNPPTRTLTVRWDGSRADDRPADLRAYLNSTYQLSNTDVNRVFYINNSTILNTSGGRGADQNALNVVLIDTGLGDPNRTIHIRLQPNSQGVFNWKDGMGETFRLAVLTVGDGSVVFEVPNTARYEPSRGLFVGPLNMAVSSTASQQWLGNNGGNASSTCQRLWRLARGTYVRGCDTHHPPNPRPGGSSHPNCSSAGSVFNGWGGQWGCYFVGLLETNGTGRLRSDLVATGDILPRGHAAERPLNMNVYLVYNGTDTRGITLSNETFHALSVYAPRMVFSVQDGDNNAVRTFGSIFASDIRLRSQNFFIAVLPGGGIGTTPGPSPVTSPNPPGPQPGDRPPTGIAGGNTRAQPGRDDDEPWDIDDLEVGLGGLSPREAELRRVGTGTWRRR